MFAISLGVTDREAINEIANREPAMDLVREQMMVDNDESWFGNETIIAHISMTNLERYLRFMHDVHISQA